MRNEVDVGTTLDHHFDQFRFAALHHIHDDVFVSEDVHPPILRRSEGIHDGANEFIVNFFIEHFRQASGHVIIVVIIVATGDNVFAHLSLVQLQTLQEAIVLILHLILIDALC